MAWLDLAGDEVTVYLSSFERMLGFVRGNARIPLRAIRHVRAVDDPWSELRGERSPGTRWARRVAIGTWRFPGGKDYVALRGRAPGLVLDLQGLEFARLVISSPDAAELAEELRLAAANAPL